MTTTDIAEIFHQANHVYSRTLGLESEFPTWKETPQVTRDALRDRVQRRLDHPDDPQSMEHDLWVAKKVSQGWKLGPVKDADKKEHPYMTPYDEVPERERDRDEIFIAIVLALRSQLDVKQKDE